MNYEKTISENKKIKLCIIVTVPSIIIEFYGRQIDFLVDQGFDVTVITSPNKELKKHVSQKARLIFISMTRIISPFQDLFALKKIFNYIRKSSFDIVQYSSPKAALLGSIVAWTCRVPVRLYLMWGLYYSEQRGLKKCFFKSVEKAICFFSTHISPDSNGNLSLAVKEKLCSISKISVVGNGSANGVDLQRFDPQRLKSRRIDIRDYLSIPDDAVVIGFVGRITKDKGIAELFKVFINLKNKYPKLYLILVGQEENERSAYSKEISVVFSQEKRVIRVGWQKYPEDYMAAMDIFVLPSYREGFGVVNIEASAMELPVISTNIPGPREAVLNGKTGILIKPKSVDDLQKAMEILLNDSYLRRDMGLAGREWVKRFDQKLLWKQIIFHRKALLQKKNIVEFKL